MPRFLANSSTAFFLPSPHRIGPPSFPVTTPFTTSIGVTSTSSIPRSRASGAAWKRVADDASVTVWPLRLCARTSARASG